MHIEYTASHIFNILIFLCVLCASAVSLIILSLNLQPAFQAGFDELVELAIEHRLGVAGFYAGA